MIAEFQLIVQKLSQFDRYKRPFIQLLSYAYPTLQKALVMLGALLAVITPILVRHDRPSARQVVPLELLENGRSFPFAPPSLQPLHADSRLVVVQPGDDAAAPGNAV